jgi:hypothetical protein
MKKKEKLSTAIIWTFVFTLLTVLSFFTPMRERIKTAKDVIYPNSADAYMGVQTFISPIQADPNGVFTINTRINDEIINENAAKLQGMPVMSGLQSENAHIFNIWSHEDFANSKKSINLVGSNYLMTDKDRELTFFKQKPIAESTKYKLYKTGNPNLYFEVLNQKPIWTVYNEYREMVDINKVWFESYKQADIPFLIFAKELDTQLSEQLGGYIFFKAPITQDEERELQQLSARHRITTQHKIPGTTYFGPSSGYESLYLPKKKQESNCKKLSEKKQGINHYQLEIECEKEGWVLFKKAYHNNWKIKLEDGTELQTYKTSPFMNSFLSPAGKHIIQVIYKNSLLERLTLLISILTFLGVIGVILKRQKQ